MKDCSDNLEQSEQKDLSEFKKILSETGCRVKEEIEPSSDFTSRVLFAIDARCEEKQRAEWAELASKHGFAEAQEVEPREGFARRVAFAIKRDRVIRSFKLVRHYAVVTSAAAALAIALLVVPDYLAKHSTQSSVVRTGPYADRDADEAKVFTQVDGAIDWLASQQEGNGSWSPKIVGGKEAFRPALTALGMMAIGRHASERRSDALEQATVALHSMQQRDGSFGNGDSTSLYNHAFATYALIERAKRTGAGLDEKIAKAIDFSISSQNPYGAWDYQVEGTGNAALTLWQVSLLLEAKKLGWRDSEGALRRAIAWLRRESAEGVFDYRQTLDRQNTASSGGIILTQLATDALVEFCKGQPALEALASNAKTSFDTAYGRHSIRRLGKESTLDSVLCKTFRTGHDFYPTLLALLSSTRN